MTIIADAGSTKIDWVLLDRDNTRRMSFVTPGHNAALAKSGDLSLLIRNSASRLLDCASEIGHIHYYGAGCAGERRDALARELSSVFTSADCLVESDMLAAARALCGNKPGIACILGTGSNSCLYDGRQIVANVSPLGFILGDEGSGAVIGRRFLGMILKRQFSPAVREIFELEYPGLTPTEIIGRVYRQERPNVYLASFAPFLSRHIAMAEIDRFITAEFERFFRFNIDAYESPLPVNFIGSIAVNFEEQLRRAAANTGHSVGIIEKSPLEALIRFHTSKFQ